MKEMLLHFVVLLSIAFNSHGGEGRKLSRKEDWDLERQLKVLNKPAVKSIHIGPREIYDCVNILEQPAFDNPLLKNHKLQLKPTNIPKELATEVLPEGKPFNFWLKDEGCPVGTVPIRRICKDDLINAKFAARNHKTEHRLDVHPTVADQQGIDHFAEYTTYAKEFYGSRARFNIWNPPITRPESSTALQMTFQSWFDMEGNADVIAAGWAVYPKIYGDNRTRLMTLWTTDGMNKTGCLDMFCPGFIHVLQDFPLGGALRPISEFGGTQQDIKLLVYQDRKTKNWWLCFGDDPLYIGYWPKELFTSLADKALQVSWGGQTFTTGGDSPPMGSGLFAGRGLGYAAYIANILLVDDKNTFRNVTSELEVINDGERCFKVMESSQSETGVGFGFFVGGPGGSHCSN